MIDFPRPVIKKGIQPLVKVALELTQNVNTGYLNEREQGAWRNVIYHLTEAMVHLRVIKS